MTDWQPGDPVHPEPVIHGSCGPCQVRWTAEADHCPECGQLSTEALRAAMTRDHDEVHETVAELIDGYLDRMPGARVAYLTDPVSHHTIGMVRHTLYLAEIAMHDEGVPVAIRRRVMRTILYAGAPSVAEGQARIEDLKAQVAAAEKMAPRAARIDDRLAGLDDLLDPYRTKP